MKRAVLIVSEELLINFIGHVKDPDSIITVKENPLPKDAKLVRAFPYRSSFYPLEGQGQIGIVLESKEFEDIPEGQLLPILPPPTFQKEVKLGDIT